MKFITAIKQYNLNGIKSSCHDNSCHLCFVRIQVAFNSIQVCFEFLGSQLCNNNNNNNVNDNKKHLISFIWSQLNTHEIHKINFISYVITPPTCECMQKMCLFFRFYLLQIE